jgi:ribokinase
VFDRQTWPSSAPPTSIWSRTSASAVILSRGSDSLPTAADIDAAAALLSTAAVTVIQLELPVEVVRRTALLATGQLIGTLAPLSPLPSAVLDRLDAVVVNAAEAASMLGVPVADVRGGPVAAARALTALGPTAAVITLGDAGAAYAGGEDAEAIPAHPVTVVDTTGAGDAALGAFAVATARRCALRTAVAAAVDAGTAAVQRDGASLAPRVRH